jgi:hypothetical protein
MDKKLLLLTVMLVGAAPLAYGQTWNKTAKVGANLSFSSSHSVVGQTDGNSQTYGLNFKGELNRLQRTDEWRNALTLQEATTQTPGQSRYLKSNDELKFETTYFAGWTNHPALGNYFRAQATAPIFTGEDAQTDAKTYRIHRINGDESQTFTGSTFRLTDGFKPLNTRESLGFYWRPADQPALHLEFRLGLAAIQTAAGGQYALGGTNAAGEVVVDELRDISQAGMEAALSAKGKLEKNSSYEIGAEAMTPFVNNKLASDHRDAWRLTDVSANAKLISNITSWAAFSYDYKLTLQPQLYDHVQQLHMMVLNINYSLL